MSNKLLVRRAAVLGAGVMGAQIAAHLTNAGVDTVLFDLAAKDGPADGVVLKAIANLGKLSPAPLAGKGLAGLKREVTVARLLRETLGERDDFIRVLDWDFEQAPYFIESEYGGLSLDRWPASGGIASVALERRR